MAKNSIPKDPASRREYGRLSVALHRAKKAAAVTNIQNSINHHRQLLGMPPREFTAVKLTRLSNQKMVYLPPEEELAKMTGDELSKWKTEERRKRKLQRAREKKELEDKMAMSLKAELADLERRVKELDDGARSFVQPVAADIIAKRIIAERFQIDGTAKSVESEAVSDEAKPKAAKTEKDLDQKPKATKNAFTISNVDTSNDGKTSKAELFSLDLDMELPEDFDPIPLDPLSNATIGIQDFVDLDDDYAVDMLFKDDDQGRDFQIDDEFPVISTSDEMFEPEDLVGDDAIGDGDLLFGNSLVDVFDNGI
ncbi:hypothetical protein ACHAWO_009895 [Cyclotella atomus]|uniref:Uncharacterized protein n=1 Tax=Cyclotella atomus TaxID=382360 RepID=A0ABD3P9Y3_9STRA